MLIKIYLSKLNKNVPIVREEKTVINPLGKRLLEAISYDLMEYNDAQSSNRSPLQIQVQGTTGSPKILTSRTIPKSLDEASVSFMTKAPHKTYSPDTPTRAHNLNSMYTGKKNKIGVKPPRMETGYVCLFNMSVVLLFLQ